MRGRTSKEIEELLYSYPVLKMSVANLKLDLEEAVEELQEDIKSKDKTNSSKCNDASNKEVANIVAQERINGIEERIRSKERVIKKIDNALTVLSEKDRKVIEMFYFKNISRQDISEHIGVSTSNIGLRKKNILSILVKVFLRA